MEGEKKTFGKKFCDLGYESRHIWRHAPPPPLLLTLTAFFILFSFIFIASSPFSFYPSFLYFFLCPFPFSSRHIGRGLENFTWPISSSHKRGSTPYCVFTNIVHIPQQFFNPSILAPCFVTPVLAWITRVIHCINLK